MLILARGPKERIFIGDDIVVTVLSIDGDKVVRLGIDAPGLSIWREELCRRDARNEQGPTRSTCPQCQKRNDSSHREAQASGKSSEN